MCSPVLQHKLRQRLGLPRSGNCFLPFYSPHTPPAGASAAHPIHSLGPPAPFHPPIEPCRARSSSPGGQRAPPAAPGKNLPCQPRGKHCNLGLIPAGGKSSRTNLPRGKREPGKGGAALGPRWFPRGRRRRRRMLFFLGQPSLDGAVRQRNSTGSISPLLWLPISAAAEPHTPAPTVFHILLIQIKTVVK